MSDDAVKLIASTTRAHREDSPGQCRCGWRASLELGYPDHLSAEIVKALGGLKPDIRLGGSYQRVGTEHVWQEWHERRWVSGWTKVQP